MTTFHSKDRPRVNGRPAWIAKPDQVLPHLLFDPLSDGNWACFIKIEGASSQTFASQMFTLTELQSLFHSWVMDPELCMNKVFGVDMKEFFSAAKPPKESNPNEPEKTK